MPPHGNGRMRRGRLVSDVRFKPRVRVVAKVWRDSVSEFRKSAIKAIGGNLRINFIVHHSFGSGGREALWVMKLT